MRVKMEATSSCDFTMCSPRYPCKQLRGLILFDYGVLSPYQKYMYGGRQWVIHPSTDDNEKTSVTMVFKDFYVTSSIYVITTGDGHPNFQEIKSDTRGQFELVAANVTSVTIYVPPNEMGKFQAFYYVGCTVLTPGTGEISFPLVEHIVGKLSTCWVIKPMEVPNRRRIYMTMRDVYLISSAKITIEDLNTNVLLAEINETMSYEVYGADTLGMETIIVDLACGGASGTCEKFGNLFSLSYYTVTSRDVACIETQKQCALHPTRLPSQICKQDCPMLEHIIEEEFEKEGPVVMQQAPILKSGILVGTVKESESMEEHGNQTESEEGGSEPPETLEGEEEEEEEEEEEGEVDARITTQRKPITPAPKRIGCLLNKKYCKCLRTINDARQYCFSRRKCSSFRFCAIGCYWARLIMCAKMTSAASIKLLSG